MPKCKNDPNKQYKGDEPSPKGLGYCAHAEKLNTKMKGKDNKFWIVTKTKDGTKRWVQCKITLKTKNIHKLNDQEVLDNLNVLLKEDKLENKNINRVFHDTISEIGKRKLLKTMDLIDEKIASTKKLGKSTLNITNKVILTDPWKTYRDVSIKLNVKPGLWDIYFHSWIWYNLPNTLVLVHKKFANSDKIKYTHIKKGWGIGIDVGGMIVTDDKDYPKYSDYEDHEDWAMKDATYNEKTFYKKLKNAYVIRTGLGDGFYHYTVGKIDKEIVKITVHFI